MGFGFARRRRDELGPDSHSNSALPDADPLARFVYAPAEADDTDDSHQHDESCTCTLRGE